MLIAITVLQAASAKDIVQGTAAGVLLQLVLGAPFLVAAPASYLRKAFELSRVFLHQWTVNLHFLPEVRVFGICIARGLSVAGSRPFGKVAASRFWSRFGLSSHHARQTIAHDACSCHQAGRRTRLHARC